MKFWKRKSALKTQPNGPKRLANARAIADLSASQHLSEAHNGHYAIALIWTVVVALLAFVFWASVTPIYEVVSGNGTIKPQGQTSRIEHPSGGIVSDLRVAEGDLVRAGDVLAVIDQTNLTAELERLAANLALIERNIARNEWILSVDWSRTDTFTPPSSPTVASQELIEEVKFRLSQIATMQAEEDVARAQLYSLETLIAATETEVEILRAQVARFETITASNVIALSELEDRRRSLLQMERSISQLSGDAEVQRANTAQIVAARGELIAQFRREAAVALSQHQEERTALQQSLVQVEDLLARSTLRAPVDGVVNALTVLNNGEVLAPGELFAEVIPVTAVLAEIEVSADRVGGITEGRDAAIKVLTYDFTRYGDLPARVAHVSPSSFVNDAGEVVFRVELSFEEPELENLRVKPGMTITADIKSDRRTVLSYLLKPVRVIADRALTEA